MEATINITDGRWSLNGQPFTQCLHDEQYLIRTVIRIELLQQPIEPNPQPTLKVRAAEIKAKYNHKFKS